MDDRKHGEGDLDDCVATKKMFAATGWVDPGRIGIVGGSYGGYMVLAALAFRPKEFAAGVDLFGVSNWLRTLESIPAWWGPTRDALYKELGDPRVDAEYLKKISPLFHADQIERPLIVLQGENDPRVLKAESQEIVDAVIGRRGPPRRVPPLPQRGARLRSQGHPGEGLPGHPGVPRQVPQGRHSRERPGGGDDPVGANRGGKEGGRPP